MKNIFPKFKIHNMSYFIFLSFLLTGYIKNILLIFLIIVVHELGHIFWLKHFSYEIDSVVIYPFGGITTTSKYLNSPINKDILIYLGGVINQIILFFFFFLFYKNNWIHENTFVLFKQYNTYLLLFNLLPIRPLDGGEIVLLIIQKSTSFHHSLHIMNMISGFFLFLFLVVNIKCNLNNYIILFFLLFKTLTNIKQKKHIENKFLLERYLHTFPYKKIEHNSSQDCTVLKKETLHFFKNQEKYRHERELLREKFDRKPYL